MEIYDKAYKLMRGGIPTTQKGIEKRLEDIFNLNEEKLEKAHAFQIEKLRQQAKRRGERPPRPAPARVAFKQGVLQQMRMGSSLNEAIKITFNTNWFTDEAIRGRINFYNSFKKQDKAFKYFRILNGWQTKIDSTKFDFVGDRTYVYDDRIYIHIKDSPKNGFFSYEIGTWNSTEGRTEDIYSDPNYNEIHKND